jgi:hypothetical protein
LTLRVIQGLRDRVKKENKTCDDGLKGVGRVLYRVIQGLRDRVKKENKD